MEINCIYVACPLRLPGSYSVVTFLEGRFFLVGHPPATHTAGSPPRNPPPTSRTLVVAMALTNHDTVTACRVCVATAARTLIQVCLGAARDAACRSAQELRLADELDDRTAAHARAILPAGSSCQPQTRHTVVSGIARKSGLLRSMATGLDLSKFIWSDARQRSYAIHERQAVQ